MACGVTLIPYVRRVVGGVGGAAVLAFIAALVHRAAAVAGANGYAPKCLLQGLQQLCAQLAACVQRQCRIVWNVAQTVMVGDLAVEKAAHEEAGREALSPQVFQCINGLRAFSEGHGVGQWRLLWARLVLGLSWSTSTLSLCVIPASRGSSQRFQSFCTMSWVVMGEELPIRKPRCRLPARGK